MSYNFYDFNNALQQRNEYVEDRLRDGSPVIGLSYEGGLLILTLRHTQRKVYEVYDRLIFGALGKQSDIESIRLAAIDSAHREGFQRSEDDVSIQRLVGFGLSPAVKRVYNDNNSVPLTFRGVFGEINATPADDSFFTLGYDGEFRTSSRCAIAAGTAYAEQQVRESLEKVTPQTLSEALAVAVEAWGKARVTLEPLPEKLDDDGEEGAPKETTSIEAIRAALDEGMSIEAGVLERHVARESRFRLVTAAECESVLAVYRGTA